MQLLTPPQNGYQGQADPYIFFTRGRYYIYVTGHDGIYAYHSDELFGGWRYYGRVMTVCGLSDFWAPCVIEENGVYYMYNSIEVYDAKPDLGGHRGALHVSRSESPLGPFTDTVRLLEPFSIDPHVVKTQAGLFLFYSSNRFEGERIGTCIYVRKMLSPLEVDSKPVLAVEPTLDEEIYRRDRYKKGQHWHTVEGAFYFEKDGWKYLMYSGNCFEQPTYYIGYAAAKTDEQDLTKVKFEKYPSDSEYCPVISANDFEEGTGHHSMIQSGGEWYAVYHARDLVRGDSLSAFDARTARICRLEINGPVITAKRYPDRL